MKEKICSSLFLCMVTNLVIWDRFIYCLYHMSAKKLMHNSMWAIQLQLCSKENFWERDWRNPDFGGNKEDWWGERYSGSNRVSVWRNHGSNTQRKQERNWRPLWIKGESIQGLHGRPSGSPGKYILLTIVAIMLLLVIHL